MKGKYLSPAINGFWGTKGCPRINGYSPSYPLSPVTVVYGGPKEKMYIISTLTRARFREELREYEPDNAPPGIYVAILENSVTHGEENVYGTFDLKSGWEGYLDRIIGRIKSRSGMEPRDMKITGLMPYEEYVRRTGNDFLSGNVKTA